MDKAELIIHIETFVGVLGEFVDDGNTANQKVNTAVGLVRDSLDLLIKIVEDEPDFIY